MAVKVVSPKKGQESSGMKSMNTWKRWRTDMGKGLRERDNIYLDILHYIASSAKARITRQNSSTSKQEKWKGNAIEGTKKSTLAVVLKTPTSF